MASAIESRRGEGEACAYCRRTMEARTSRSQIAATRDHYPEPKCIGGRKTVWACYQCNSIKGNMVASDWDAFMAANPAWWRMPQYQRERDYGSVLRRSNERSLAKWERKQGAREHLIKIGLIDPAT